MSFRKYRKKVDKAVGGNSCMYGLVIIVALVIATGFSGLDMSGFQTGDSPDGATTIIYEYVTETVTVTDPIPEGTWYHLKVMFTWADWVVPIDYRDIYIGVSTLAFVGIDDYTFNRIDENTWYEFDTFRVEDGAQGYISMMSMIDPIDMSFSYETELDYNLATSGPWSGVISFYDSSAPMATGPAGTIMFSWVLL